MVSFTSPAFILRSIDRGSVDRLYTLFTRDRGKIDVIAKGIRKKESKLQSSMQVAAELEVYVIAQRRFTLGGCVVREVWPRIFSSLPALWACAHALDLIDALTEHEHKDQAVFSLLRQYVSVLSYFSDIQPQRILYSTVAFDLRLLEVLGHAPALSPVDEKDDRFALRAGGLHAKKDIPGLPYYPMTKDGRSLLRFAQQKPLEDCFRVALSSKQVKAQRSYIRALLEEYDAAMLPSDRTLADFVPMK